MDTQLSLLDSPSSGPDRYSLFLAIQPDRDTAECIHRLATDLKAAKGLTGTPRPLDHLHITLHYFGHHSEIPEQTVQSIDYACSQIAASTNPFDVKFGQVCGFQGSRAFVLAERGNANPALAAFHQQLARGLTVHGIRILSHGRFNPHVTLLYPRNVVPPEPIDPIQWKVEEFVLIRSEEGKTKYEYLGRWKLAGDPT
jgi:2'-5' RNA ligase